MPNSETSTERGFGTGLRAKLQGPAPDEAPRSPGEAIAAAETLSSDPFEVEQLRAELSASLAREQELRTTLQVDTALDETMSQDVAAKLAELDHRAS